MTVSTGIVPKEGALVAVSEAKTSVSTPGLSGFEKNQQGGGGLIGLILPPPDLRAIVDKTAQFIAKNGEEFEQRILENERENAKFKFLAIKDPYNAYYKAKIAEFRGETTVAGAGASATGAGAGGSHTKEGQGQGAATTRETPSVVVKQDEQLKKSVVVDQVLETPAAEQYTVRVPEGLAALDLDVVRLTAQFVARNGKQFLSGLSSREQNNPQFNFLKPTHSMFTFFTDLTDAYSKVLMPTKKTLKDLEHDKNEPGEVLARCLRRLEWMRVQEEEKKAREDKEEAERTAMALIDWQDFVVVETVDFYDEEDQQLPEPLTTQELVAMAKVEQMAEEEERQEEVEMEMEMDDEEMELVAEAGGGSGSGAGQAVQAVQAAPDVPALEPEMKIVKNYKRLSQVEKATGGEKGTKFVVSPITGELISVDDMAEHMRISLIDPKWKEQRDAMLAKIKDTTKATDDEIARNVSSLANTRPDIFGSTEDEISRIVAAEMERSKKAADFMQKNQRGPMERPTGADQGAMTGPSTSSAPQPPPPPSSSSSSSLPPHGGRGRGFPHPMHHSMRPPMPGMAGAPPPYGFRPQMQAPMPPHGMNMNNRRMPMPLPPHGMNMRMPRGPPPPGFRPPMPPPLPMGGAPPPPPPSSSPSAAEGPEAKRPKLGDSTVSGGASGSSQALQPEAQWLASHSGAVKIKVKLPNNVKNNEKLNGEVLEIDVESLSITVQALKQMLSPMLGLAANKQKLQVDTVGFLKDNLSLAHYNLSEESTLSLGVKERGGRKK